MAERVEILNIETKTLKELRAELKELKSSLEQMVIGSDEYNQTLQEITTRQKELSSVTKSSVADMEGSYNALTKQLSALRAAWKATGDEAERNAIGEQMNELNNQLKALDASVGSFQRNVGNYSSALDGLGDKIKETGIDFDSAINSSNNWIEKGDNINKASIAMVASFSMVNQALSLMGEESDGTREILEKLQIVMAMTAGFKQIAEGAKGFLTLSKNIKIATAATNGFKKAMIATGWGAIIVALGAIVAYWEDISNFIGLSEKRLGKFNEKMFKTADRDFELEIRLIEADGGSEEDVLLKKQKYYRKMVDEAQNELDRLKNADKEQIDEAKKILEEYLNLQQQANDDLTVFYAKQRRLNKENAIAIQKQQKEEFEELQKQLKEDRDAALEYIESLKPELEGLASINKEYEDSHKQLKDYLNKNLITQKEYEEAKLVLENEYNKKLTELQLQEADEATEILENKLNDLVSLYNSKKSKLDTEYEKKVFDQLRSGDESGALETQQKWVEEQTQLYENLKIQLQEYGNIAVEELTEVDNKLNELTMHRIELEDAEHERRLGHVVELSDLLTSTADAIGSEWGNVFSTLTKGIEDVGKSINKGEKGWTKYGKVASAGIGVAASMLDTLAGMQDTQTKEGFEKNKKLQIAAATMSMLAGIVNTWQSVMSKENSWMTIWGQVAAGTSISAMMLATGLAQINQIKSTTFEGGGGGSAATPNITALSAIQNPVDNVNIVEGASAEGEVKDTKVYVLESDIASVNKKVNVYQNEATF